MIQQYMACISLMATIASIAWSINSVRNCVVRGSLKAVWGGWGGGERRTHFVACLSHLTIIDHVSLRDGVTFIPTPTVIETPQHLGPQYVFFHVVQAGVAVRPFLTQPDSASLKRPFSTGIFWSFFLSSVVSRVDFIFFVLFLEAVGMREYCCTAVEIAKQLCASRFLREQRLDEPSSQRVGGSGLSRKPPQLRLWRCTQPRAAKATAGAAVVGSMGSTPRAAAVV